MRFLIPFLLCARAWAVYAISPTTINPTNIAWGGSDWGQAITISGTGTWTLAANGCLGQLASNKQTGTAPDTMYLFYGLGSNTTLPTAPGVPRQCDLSFGNGVLLHVNETILAHGPRIYMTNALKVPDASLGCTQTGTDWFYFDLCATVDPRPGGNLAGWPTALGGAFTDARLGGVWTRITPTNRTHNYTVWTAFSLDEQYVLVLDLTVSGTGYVYARDGSGLIYGPIDFTADGMGVKGCEWSSKTTGVIYCFNTTQYRKYTLGVAPAVTSNGVIYTDANGVNNDSFGVGGGSGKLSKTDWTGYYSSTQFVAINLADPTQKATYTRSSLPNAPSGGWRDFIITPDVDSRGFYYLTLEAAAGATNRADRFFKFAPSDTTLTLMLNGTPVSSLDPGGNSALGSWTPTWPQPNGAVGLSATHNDTYCWGGECYWRSNAPQWQMPQYLTAVGAMRFSAETQMVWNAEVGGGLDWQKALYSAGYTSCSTWAPLCAHSYDQYGIKTNFLITSITGSAPYTVTTDSAHGFAPAQQVWQNAIGGLTNVNKLVTILATPTSTTYTVNDAITGTYTAATGAVVDNVIWTSENLSGRELDVCRQDNGHCRRLTKQHSVEFSNTRTGASGYFDNGMANISPTGKYVVMRANGGLPDNMADFIISTGFDLDANTKPWQFDKSGNGIYVTPGDTFASVRVVVPSADVSGSCVVDFSATSDFATIITTTLAAGLGLERFAKLTGLTAATGYWYRGVCNNNVYGSGQMKTLPTLSGTGSLIASVLGATGVNNVIVDWDTTSGTFANSTASAPCSAGATCPVTVSTTKGLIYYRVRQRDAGNVNLAGVPMREFSEKAQ